MDIKKWDSLIYWMGSYFSKSYFRAANYHYFGYNKSDLSDTKISNVVSGTEAILKKYSYPP